MITECFLGQYDSVEDYALEILEDSLQLSNNLTYYFDWEQYARDLVMAVIFLRLNMKIQF